MHVVVERQNLSSAHIKIPIVNTSNLTFFIMIKFLYILLKFEKRNFGLHSTQIFQQLIVFQKYQHVP